MALPNITDLVTAISEKQPVTKLTKALLALPLRGDYFNGNRNIPQGAKDNLSDVQLSELLNALGQMLLSKAAMPEFVVYAAFDEDSDYGLALNITLITTGWTADSGGGWENRELTVDDFAVTVGGTPVDVSDLNEALGGSGHTLTIIWPDMSSVEGDGAVFKVIVNDQLGAYMGQIDIPSMLVPEALPE